MSTAKGNADLQVVDEYVWIACKFYQFYIPYTILIMGAIGVLLFHSIGDSV